MTACVIIFDPVVLWFISFIK